MRPFFVSNVMVCLILISVLQTSAAPTPVLNDVNGNQISSSGNYSVGFEFTVNTNLSITHLGFWDGSPAGLWDSHIVKVWDVANTTSPLISETVPSGTTGTGVGSYRYIAIAESSQPELIIGHTYRIAGLIGESTSDPWIYNATGYSIDPRINLTTNQALYANGTGYPDTALSSSTYNLPAVNFQVDAVPIPGAVWLLGSGLIGLVGLRRKLRK